jgi:hypothetical protein
LPWAGVGCPVGAPEAAPRSRSIPTVRAVVVPTECAVSTVSTVSTYAVTTSMARAVSAPTVHVVLAPTVHVVLAPTAHVVLAPTVQVVLAPTVHAVLAPTVRPMSAQGNALGLPTPPRQALKGRPKIGASAAVRPTAEIAKAFAESEFEKYRVVQDRLFESDFDRMLKQLPSGGGQP